jgi:hypothetical protein
MKSKSIHHIKFCPNHYKEIENYQLALNDNFEGWVCHHRNGEQFSREWLKQNKMYFNREDPHEFIFVPLTDEMANKYGVPTHSALHKQAKGHSHKQTEETKTHLSIVGKKSWENKSEDSKAKCIELLRKQARAAGMKGGRPVGSVFGLAFKEHFGFTKKGHESLYAMEHKYFSEHGTFRWLIKEE